MMDGLAEALGAFIALPRGEQEAVLQEERARQDTKLVLSGRLRLRDTHRIFAQERALAALDREPAPEPEGEG